MFYKELSKLKKKILISISVVLVLILVFLGYLYFKPLEVRTTDYQPEVAFTYKLMDNYMYDDLVKIVEEYNKIYDYTDNHKINLGQGDRAMTFMTFDKKRVTVNFSSLMYCAESDKFILEQLLELNALTMPYLKTEEDHFAFILFNAALMRTDKNFESYMNLIGELAEEYASHSDN